MTPEIIAIVAVGVALPRRVFGHVVPVNPPKVAPTASIGSRLKRGYPVIEALVVLNQPLASTPPPKQGPNHSNHSGNHIPSALDQ